MEERANRDIKKRQKDTRKAGETKIPAPEKRKEKG